MSTCCDKTDPPTAPASNATLTVALAGNPNCGKTTLFNGLTGLRQKVANYPGVTVEKKTGRCKLDDGRWATVIDLPGTYSLISRSPDELVAMEVLRGLRPDTPKPDVVVVVVDASNLQRNLYLVSQLVELGRPLVVALNMMDVAERRGLHVSPAALERELGVPVVPVVGHKKQGLAELKKAITRARVAPMPDWPLPEPMKRELVTVGGRLAQLEAQSTPRRPGEPAWICHPDPTRKIDRFEAMAERLLIGDRAPDVQPVADDHRVSALLGEATRRLGAVGIDPMQADIEAHYRWIEHVSSRATAAVEDLAAMGAAPEDGIAPPTPTQRTLTERLDAVFMHKVWGMVVFVAIMGLLFVSIFWLAEPVMGGIENAIEKLGKVVSARMADGPLKDLVNDGIFAGVGGVVVFVPQIALLFFFLAVLEDSGYLARAAFLMDRALSKVGLHGKSFIPLLSSFACAIPGIMATRTIENRRERLATILIAPFMSCSARLPVYTLLIGTFFTGALLQAGIMLGLYVTGILAAAVTAFFFKRTLTKGGSSAFILEMPTYKLPQMSQVFRQVWHNTKAFLVKAGTIIFCLSVVIWALSYYGPTDVRHAFGGAESRVARLQAEGAEEKAVGQARLEDSFAGRMGKAMEPAIRPLGYDWKMGVGLVGAFAAREIFVSTVGIVYSVGEVEDDTTDLEAAMRADTYADGRPVWTPLVAVSLLVWFVLAMQCMSTLAIVRRETGGWRWPIFQLVYMNALAYVICLGIYQIGSMFGLA